MAKLENLFCMAAVFLKLISYALALLGNDDIAEILSRLNAVRTNVEPHASNMNKLVWNTRLAIGAKIFAENCKLESNPNRFLITPTFTTVGEIWTSIPQLNPNYTQVVDQDWDVQKNVYNFENNTCNDATFCSFYIQLVWADSIEIGCGAAICSSTEEFFVNDFINLFCYYGPGGNIPGESPYQAGIPCSHCNDDQNCIDNLCDLPPGKHLTYKQDEDNFIVTWEAFPLNFLKFCINITTSTIPEFLIKSYCDPQQALFLYQVDFSLRCIPINITAIEFDYEGIPHSRSVIYDSCTEPCLTLAKCDDPLPPVDGYLSSTNNTDENSVVTYWCDPGYYLSPPVSFSTCTNSGVWDPEPLFTECLVVPTCKNRTVMMKFEGTSIPRISIEMEAARVAFVGFILFITGAVATTLSWLSLLKICVGRKYTRISSCTSEVARMKI